MTRRAFLSVTAVATRLPAPAQPCEAGFDMRTFTAWGTTKKVYSLGSPGQGHPVLFLHELPGLVPESFDFVRRLRTDGGYSVYLPLFFGRACGHSNLRVALQTPCWGSQFNCHARHSLGGITNWIADYCLFLASQHKHAVAVIGNCLTGATPLALLARGETRGKIACAVAAQPALPIGIRGMPHSEGARNAAGLTDPELDRAARSGVPVMALRFDDDWVVPNQRITALQDAFHRRGGNFDYRQYKAASHGRHHAVLTIGHGDAPQAYTDVLAFLRRHMA